MNGFAMPVKSTPSTSASVTAREKLYPFMGEMAELAVSTTHALILVEE